MNSELVTIAIPAFKSAFLSEAISSAINQYYTNIEIIIVDDCSPNPIKKIVDSFNDTRIRYYRNDKNLGKISIVHNWNKCLEYAHGKYFVLLCDDDILEADFITEMLKLTKKYPNCNTFHARCYSLFPDGHKVESSIWPEYETHNDYIRERLNKKRHHTISEFLYRIESIKKNKYVVFPSGFYSDNASIIKMTEDGGISSTEKCLVTFRYSNEHITSNTNPKNCWDKYQAALQYWSWIHHYSIAIEFEKEIREEVECTIYNSFMPAPWKMKLKMLITSPLAILPFKIKLGYLIRLIHL